MQSLYYNINISRKLQNIIDPMTYVNPRGGVVIPRYNIIIIPLTYISGEYFLVTDINMTQKITTTLSYTETIDYIKKL